MVWQVPDQGSRGSGFASLSVRPPTGGKPPQAAQGGLYFTDM
jgi:hypothetical protein